jgi:hypothetical protein
MPPAIEDTISDDSPNHWNAATKAMKSFNASISSSGGRATIVVEIPTVSNRKINEKIGAVELNENVMVLVRNATGSYGVNSSEYSLEGGVLTLFNIDTADVKEVSVKFEGRKLGDVTGKDRIYLGDARDIAWYCVSPGKYPLTDNQKLYADVNNDGNIRLGDARDVAWKSVSSVYDDNYQFL